MTAEAFAYALPDQIGSLVFVLEPEVVADVDGYRRSIRFLADRIRSFWLKVIVLEPRLTPLLEGLAEHERVKTLVFWQSPEELEASANQGRRSSLRSRRPAP